MIDKWSKGRHPGFEPRYCPQGRARHAAEKRDSCPINLIKKKLKKRKSKSCPILIIYISKKFFNENGRLCEKKGSSSQNN